MKFTKMHGIGNDYIYIDCFKESVENPEKLAFKASDRHFGIGGDGVILIKPSEIADVCMEMYNMDGSRGEMCGNGIRCVGKYAYDHGLVSTQVITVETDAGIKTLNLTLDNGKVKLVQVDMGKPVLTSNNNETVPVKTDVETLLKLPVWETLIIGKEAFQIIGISMGNPHVVLFLEDIASLDLEKIGPQFEHHKRFPDRTNTEFVRVLNRSEVDMRVWERGSGETLACGTGACACVTAGMLAGYLDAAKPVTVHLLGGDLQIAWNQETGHIEMTGPATEVFTGDYKW